MKKLQIQKKVLGLMLLSLVFNVSLQGQDTITVTKTTDPDPWVYLNNSEDPEVVGTLQYAIRTANNSPADAVVIVFNIPGLGPHVIYLNNYLPALTKPITIDGSTQPGYNYNNGPSIIIDGTNVPIYSHCFNFTSYADSGKVIGIHIRNFWASNGVMVFTGNITIKDCMFWNVGGQEPGYPWRDMGIYIAGPNAILQGNIIGTDISGTQNHGCPAEAVYVQSQWLRADNCIIGGSVQNESNLIANSGWSGITIDNAKYNKITRNRIYNNGGGINLVLTVDTQYWGNEGKTAPIITSTTNNTISGTSAPNDIIEIFGSTGNENANEYLTTTVADSSGSWTAQTTTTYPNVIATGTDGSNNTSALSIAFQLPQPERFEKGEIFVKTKDDYPFAIMDYDSSTSISIQSFIIGFDSISQVSGINKIERTFKILGPTSDRLRNIFTIYFNKDYPADSLVSFLNSKNEVLYAEKVPIYRLYQIPPSDYSNYNLWHLDIIDAPLAWGIVSNSSGVKIAVVDDAVKVDHPDLAINVISGYDVADDDIYPDPLNSTITHGTHVSGIAGGMTDNSGFGIASISYNAKIIPVKSKRDDNTNPETLDQPWLGVQWAIHNDADIINMSWGSSDYSSTFQVIIDEAYEKGIILVAAAGNDGLNPAAHEFHYPAACDHVIAVGSSNELDQRSYFSCYGDATHDWIHVMAPGSNIWSTTADGSFASLSGTSQAAPLVSGLCALMLSRCPTCTPDQIENCLVSTCNTTIYDNSGIDISSHALGAGRIDADDAIHCLESVPPVAQFSSNYTVVCPGGPI